AETRLLPAALVGYPDLISHDSERTSSMTGLASAPATMLDKIWARHLIQSRPDGQDLMFIDRHFIHDVTAPAFELLRARKLTPRAPHRTFGVPDHYVPTHARDMNAINHPERRAMIDALMNDSAEAASAFSRSATSGRGSSTSSGRSKGSACPARRSSA